MATPINSRPTDKKYLGNSDTDHMEVHDLLNEKRQCQINEIISAGNAVVFYPDTLEQAHNEGYDNGAYCIGDSMR